MMRWTLDRGMPVSRAICRTVRWVRGLSSWLNSISSTTATLPIARAGTRCTAFFQKVRRPNYFINCIKTRRCRYSLEFLSNLSVKEAHEYCKFVLNIPRTIQAYNLRRHQLSPNSTCCATSRHVTTRYLAHEFWYRKKSYVLCRRCCTASATGPSPRARQARYTTQFVCNVYKVMIAVIQ